MQCPPFAGRPCQPTRRTGLVALLCAALATLAVCAATSRAAAAAEVSERKAVALPARSSFKPTLPTAQHLRLLRQGGLVLYMRHGPSDARRPDQVPVQLNNCDSQRPLTDAGRQYLAQMARDVDLLQLPYQGVISSPFCRVEESARRVFGEPVEVDMALRYTAAMPELEKLPAIERTRYWLSLPVAEKGLNRVVVAHGPNLAEIMDYLPPEGTLLIFRPLGLQSKPSFEYLASVAPGQWGALLKTLGVR